MTIGRFEDGQVSKKRIKIDAQRYPEYIVKFGSWEDGSLVSGVERFGNGDIYVGNFRDGWEHGQGQLTAPNGVTYDGEFSLGHLHGDG